MRQCPQNERRGCIRQTRAEGDPLAGRRLPSPLTRLGRAARQDAPNSAVMDPEAATYGAAWGASCVLGEDRCHGFGILSSCSITN